MLTYSQYQQVNSMYKQASWGAFTKSSGIVDRVLGTVNTLGGLHREANPGISRFGVIKGIGKDLAGPLANLVAHNVLNKEKEPSNSLSKHYLPLFAGVGTAGVVTGGVLAIKAWNKLNKMRMDMGMSMMGYPQGGNFGRRGNPYYRY